METEKISPNDGSNYYQEGNGENDNSGQTSREKQGEYEEFVKEREVSEKERNEKRQEEISQLVKKGGEKREEKAVVKEVKDKENTGAKAENKKDFLSTLKKNEGEFRHGTLHNFSTSGGNKIKKALKRVSGVSSTEKEEFYNGLKAYGMKKSTLKVGELKEYYMGVKHKFRGSKGKAGFKNMEKNIGEDGVNSLKGIKKRSAKKMFNELTGVGKQKYQRRSNSRNSSASSSVSRNRNRF